MVNGHPESYALNNKGQTTSGTEFKVSIKHQGVYKHWSIGHHVQSESMFHVHALTLAMELCKQAYICTHY